MLQSGCGAGCAALTADGSVDRRGGNQYCSTCFLVGEYLGRSGANTREMRSEGVAHQLDHLSLDDRPVRYPLTPARNPRMPRSPRVVTPKATWMGRLATWPLGTLLYVKPQTESTVEFADDIAA